MLLSCDCRVIRGRFEGMCSAVFRSCLEPLVPLMDSAGVAREQLDHVSHAKYRY